MNKINLTENTLIVSCQALEDEPLHGSEIMAKMAIAAEMGGASAIRANSPKDIIEIRKAVKLPIIGLWKQETEEYPVYITPTYQHIKEVLEAGANYVAIDCTNRKRPEGLEEIFDKIRNEFPDKGIVADISCIEDVKAILQLKPDFFATTLSGYTEDSKGRPTPDLPLIKEIKDITDIPILAEGNYKTGVQAAKAMELGAYAVVMGGAITRPQNITSRIWNEIQENYHYGERNSNERLSFGS